VTKSVQSCFDVLPLEARLVSAAVVDHTRGQFTALPQVASPQP
jgi:hypothetical protein